MRGERFGSMVYESFRGIQAKEDPNCVEQKFVISIKDIAGGKINFNTIRPAQVEIPVSKIDTRLREHDLIISLRGTSFKVAVFEVPAEHPNFINLIRNCYLDENLACFRLSWSNSKLIAAYLNSPIGQQYLDQMSTGSRVKSLSMKSLENMRFPLPSPAYQEELIRFLNASDTLLQHLENEKLGVIQTCNSVIEKYMEVS